MSRQLFARANTAQAMSELPAKEIARLIAKSTFADRKGEQILAIAQTIVQDHNGKLPCDETVMLSFKGVGPKCANLALGIACEQPSISCASRYVP